MKRRELLQSGVAAALALKSMARAHGQTPHPPERSTNPGDTRNLSETRADWVAMLDRMCRPLFTTLSERRLKATMPIEAHAGEHESRRHTTYLEALGRSLAGIAPWLEHGDANGVASGAATGAEGNLRARYCEWARAGIAAAVDPKSPDYMEFGGDRQTIVDTAFLALGMLRAPGELREKLPAPVRTQLADAMRATRRNLPPYNNWLLFAAAIEAGLFALGEPWDRERVDYALRSHAAWYLGDGVYGDGPEFHQDYYNSFVIHPFLMAVLDAVGGQEPSWSGMRSAVRERMTRYAAIQERMVAPDGSYPVVGRSIAYRCGAFHALSDASLRRMLPEGVAPEQVRGALTAVMRRTLTPPGTFGANGWLQIGLAGHQPSAGEVYISTGSLYLCTAAFLPLGLPAADPFWAAPAKPWTQAKVWAGEDFPADHALSDPTHAR